MNALGSLSHGPFVDDSRQPRDVAFSSSEDPLALVELNVVA